MYVLYANDDLIEIGDINSAIINAVLCGKHITTIDVNPEEWYGLEKIYQIRGFLWKFSPICCDGGFDEMKKYIEDCPFGEERRKILNYREQEERRHQEIINVMTSPFGGRENLENRLDAYGFSCPDPVCAQCVTRFHIPEREDGVDTIELRQHKYGLYGIRLMEYRHRQQDEYIVIDMAYDMNKEEYVYYLQHRLNVDLGISSK